MRGISLVIAVAAVFGVVGTSAVKAAPAAGRVVTDAAMSLSSFEDVRTYCYNRYTGQFKHWGPCGSNYGYYRRPSRTYCYNRYTGRFKHWGACNY